MNTWNLTDLYASMDDPQIQKDFAACDKLIKKLQSYRGKIATLTSAEILKLIETWEEFAYTGHKLGLFSGLLEATNVNVPEVTRFVKQTEEQLLARGKKIIFIDVEFSKLSKPQWQNLLKSSELKPYKKFLTKLAEDAKHTLSELEEKILAEKSQTSWQALSHLFAITTNTLTTKWGSKDITLEEVITKLHDPSGDVRKKAAFTIHELLKFNDKTTPAILNSLVQDKSVNDRLRGRTYPEEARFMHEDVDKETVEALITAVSNSYNLVERYYKLKKKIFGVNEFYWWDRYAPLPKTKTKVSQEQAKAMVLDAFTSFSPEVAKIAENMFTQEHIDWVPKPTKRGGAFCAFGGKNIYPYVLLNFTSSLRDVSTLAHELGHAVHDVFASDNNVFFQTHPSLALAEIASVFSESILLERLLADPKTSKEDRIGLLMATVEDTFATVYRQITMFQFEQALHQKRREEGELSKEQIDELWHATMKQPFESSLKYTDEHKNTWMYVWHVFDMPFYVFAYAFAQLCVLALYKQYLEQGESFVPTYLNILKAGGSLSPKDNLKQAGLDISKPEFWQQGLDVIKDYIDQLEAEIKK